MEKAKNGYRKTGAQDILDVAKKRSTFDRVSALNMPCCDRFLRWNGSGMKGLMAESADCPLCGAKLAEACGGKAPVEG